MKIEYIILVLLGCASLSCSAENQLMWEHCRPLLPEGFYSVDGTNDYFWREVNNNIESIRFIKDKVFDVNEMKKESSFYYLSTISINGYSVISYSIRDKQVGVDTGRLYAINTKGGIISLDGANRSVLEEFLNNCGKHNK